MAAARGTLKMAVTIFNEARSVGTRTYDATRRVFNKVHVLWSGPVKASSVQADGIATLRRSMRSINIFRK